MANADTLKGLLDAIGDAIRAKTGGSAKLTLAEMPDEIAGISGMPTIDAYCFNKLDPLFSRNVPTSQSLQFVEGVSALIGALDTSRLTNMDSMFFMFIMYHEDQYVDAPSFASFDTSSVTSMASMFNNWSWISGNVAIGGPKKGDVSLTSFDTSNVTSMAQMFAAAKIGTLDISSFDTSSVTSMASMFDNALIDKIITGAGWTQAGVSVAANKAKFAVRMKNESGKTYSSGTVIPNGAHTYVTY